MYLPTSLNKAISDTFAEPPSALSPNGHSQDTRSVALIVPPLNVPSETTTLKISQTLSTTKQSNHTEQIKIRHPANVPNLQLTESRSTSSIDTFYSAVWHPQPHTAKDTPRTVLARNISKGVYRTKPITINTAHLPPPPRYFRPVQQPSPRIKIRVTAHDADVCIAEVSTKHSLGKA